MVKLQSKPGVVTSGVRWYHRLKESQIKVKHCPGSKATLIDRNESSMWKLRLPLHTVKCASLLEVSQYRCPSSCMDLIGPRHSHLALSLAEQLGRQ